MTTRTLSALSVLSLAVPAALFAQVRLSEAASVSQTVDGTVITVNYSRPQLRGRAVGPDGVLHVEHMWTPGANWATTLEVSRPVRLNGSPVAAGKYSVWLETSDKDWTVHLHAEPRRFHTMGPKRADMAVTFSATPEQATEPVEMLTFDVPEVRRDGTTLRFRWAKVVLPLRIQVEPTRRSTALTEAKAAPYLGSWIVQHYNDLMEKSPELKMEIVLAQGVLRGKIQGRSRDLEFSPLPDGTFQVAFVRDTTVLDVETVAPIVFEIQDGKAVRWYARPVKGFGEEPWIWARRP